MPVCDVQPSGHNLYNLTPTHNDVFRVLLSYSCRPKVKNKKYLSLTLWLSVALCRDDSYKKRFRRPEDLCLLEEKEIFSV